jgi:ABC-type transporter Mla maintaining outer membrane lipid asymmetry ATPase subunit MlaF
VSETRASGGAVVSARDLAAGYGARLLFSDLDLVIAPGDVVGVVGAYV